MRSDQEELPAGGKYALALTLLNIGEQNASDVKVLLTNDNNLLRPQTPIMDIASVDPGSAVDVNYIMIVDEDAVPGAEYGAIVMLSFWDNYGTFHDFSDQEGLYITVSPPPREDPPSPPSIIVERVDTSEEGVAPGEDFTVTLTLRNVGETDARNIQVLLTDASGILRTGSPVQEVDLLKNNSVATVAFRTTVDDSAELGGYYTAHIRFMFLDAKGNTYSFDENEDSMVMVRIGGGSVGWEVKEPEAAPPSPLVEYGLFLLGILILIAAIVAVSIGGMIISRSLRKGDGTEGRAEDRKAGEDAALLGPPGPAPGPGPAPMGPPPAVTAQPGQALPPGDVPSAGAPMAEPAYDPVPDTYVGGTLPGEDPLAVNGDMARQPQQDAGWGQQSQGTDYGF